MAPFDHAPNVWYVVRMAFASTNAQHFRWLNGGKKSLQPPFKAAQPEEIATIEAQYKQDQETTQDNLKNFLDITAAEIAVINPYSFFETSRFSSRRKVFKAYSYAIEVYDKAVVDHRKEYEKAQAAVLRGEDLVYEEQIHLSNYESAEFMRTQVELVYQKIQKKRHYNPDSVIDRLFGWIWFI